MSSNRCGSLLVRVVLLAALAALVDTAATAFAATPTQVRVLVVKETWGPQPFTDTDVDTTMQDVAQFYATGSFGAVAISYTQTPWLDVMPGPLSCTDEIAQLPRFAVSAGWTPGAYDRVVYLVPIDRAAAAGCVNSAFQGAAVGTIINSGQLLVGLVIHELGHSFAMGHAGLLTCWYQRKARQCSADPYGDTADVMGGANGSDILAYTGDFGALQKALAGWLTPRYINKPGTYKLAPLEVRSALPQALVIRGSAYEYWIDVRAPVGNDAHASGPPFTGFAVHRIAEDPLAAGAEQLTPAYLVPNADSTSYYTATGNTFTLPGLFTLSALSRRHGVMTIRFRQLAH